MKQTQVSSPIAFDKVPTVKRKVKQELGRFELAFVQVLYDNQNLLAAATTGSLPLVMGAFIQKFGLDVFTAKRKVRIGFLNKILRRLVETRKIKVEFLTKSPIGPGYVSLA